MKSRKEGDMTREEQTGKCEDIGSVSMLVRREIKEG
jgi:hypothetical protein